MSQAHNATVNRRQSPRQLLAKAPLQEVDDNASFAIDPGPAGLEVSRPSKLDYPTWTVAGRHGLVLRHQEREIGWREDG